MATTGSGDCPPPEAEQMQVDPVVDSAAKEAKMEEISKSDVVAEVSEPQEEATPETAKEAVAEPAEEATTTTAHVESTEPASEATSQPEAAVTEEAVRPQEEPLKETSETVKPAEEVAPAAATTTSTPAAKKQKVDLSNLPTRQYLDQTVVPILLQGLSWLAKTRPEDPISELSKYLIDHKPEHDSEAFNGN